MFIITSIVKDLIFLMKKSQTSDDCQSLMIQTLESQIHRFDQKIKVNPLNGLLDVSNLSRTGQRDLHDLTDITVTHSMTVCEDLEFQFENLLNLLIYEKEYLNIKLSRLDKKLVNEVNPSLEQKQQLRDFLEQLYDGQ